MAHRKQVTCHLAEEVPLIASQQISNIFYVKKDPAVKPPDVSLKQKQVIKKVHWE